MRPTATNEDWQQPRACGENSELEVDLMMPTGARVPTAHCGQRAIAGSLAVVSLVVLPACSSDDQGAAAASSGVDAATDGGADTGPARPGNQDPKDLDPANGDPALDIASSQIFVDNGAPWVRVMFYGDWPPSSQLYSRSCTVVLATENAPVATYTTQANRGSPATVADGIDEAKITFVVEPTGFRVLFGDSKLVFDHYGIECSVQRTADTTWVQDTSGNFAVTEKIQRTFGN